MIGCSAVALDDLRRGEAGMARDMVEVGRNRGIVAGGQAPDPAGVYGAVANANTFLLDAAPNCAAPPAGSIQSALCGRPNHSGNALDFAVFRRRMTEVGTRQETFNVNQFQFISGLEGDLGDGWADAIHQSVDVPRNRLVVLDRLDAVDNGSASLVPQDHDKREADDGHADEHFRNLCY